MSLRDELIAEVGPSTHVADLCGRAADELLIKEMKIEQQRREIEDLRRKLGGGCDANNGGDHTVVTEGRYKFCGGCGETLTGVRYCHAPRRSR